jgi:formyl-CoA transferase/CoA:oxalate CoA-transferase
VRSVLAGIKVLDFTRAMAGPYGTMVLADFGADVIKVEQPPKTDDGVISDRGSGLTKVGGESPMFMTYNRNKRSICVDLRHPEAKSVLRRMIPAVDVLVQNFRPGVMENMGLGWNEVRTLNRRLIYVSINGFGTNGPWKDRPGIDVVIQALSGVMSVTGEPGGEPVLCGVPVGDFSTAMVSVQGTLMALVDRFVTNEGQHVEIPMLAVAFQSLAQRLGPYFVTGKDPDRIGSQHEQFAPFQAYQTADGWGIGGVTRAKLWEPFCRVIGLPDLADDPRFATNAERVAHRDELNAILQPRFRTRKTAEWERIFMDVSVPFGAVNSFSQALESEQAQANNMITAVNHPRAGTFRTVAQPIRLSASPAAIYRPAPLYGQHNREVLTELGFGIAEIDGLLERNVLSADPHCATVVPA